MKPREIKKYQKVILTGFMGTGKTVVGKKLASKLQWLFFDTDALIENAEGCLIAQIFEKKGEDYFRKLEKRCFEGLISMNEVVIATGGKTLLNSENLSMIHEESALVCLWASEEDLRKRLDQDKKRPLLKSGFESAMQLLKEREPAYKKLGFQIDTSSITPEKVCIKILGILGFNAFA